MTSEVANTGVTTTEGIAQSLLPYYMDGGKKARYLSYMIASFSVREALKLTGVTHKTLTIWRNTDPKFVELEESTPELKRQLADQLIDIEFTRNFRLILDKDFQILYKDATSETLTEKEQQYLLVIRKFYTPQQLMMIKQLVSGDGDRDKPFDFTRPK